MSNTKLTFPCEFPIKVMGPNTQEFEMKIIALVRKYVPDLGEGSVFTRLSKDKNYQSITITVHATSQKQLDDIYQEISSDKDVLMAL